MDAQRAIATVVQRHLLASEDQLEGFCLRIQRGENPETVFADQRALEDELQADYRQPREIHNLDSLGLLIDASV